ncbi:hypothetical protein QJQ45_014210 [Haematococcus lacustris]|nr:hypothetical protein QJQ45_014210 [Haematococcus lacustris]
MQTETTPSNWAMTLYPSCTPCTLHICPKPGPSTPLPARRSKRTKAEPEVAEPTQPTKGKGKGKAAKAKPAPQPGRWLDRDCNAALNMQRIGESKWRPLELCYWPEQGKLPVEGKEYPGLGYKWLLKAAGAATQKVAGPRQGPAAEQLAAAARTAAGIAPEAGMDGGAGHRGSGSVMGAWRDCNAALNMQRIGESKWRPLELCWWPDQGALPAKGKEYPGLGYKRVRDKPPRDKAQPAAAQ